MGKLKVIALVLWRLKNILIKPRSTLFKIQDILDANSAVKKNKSYRRSGWFWANFKRKFHRTNVIARDEWKYLFNKKNRSPRILILIFLLVLVFIALGILIGYLIWGLS